MKLRSINEKDIEAVIDWSRDKAFYQANGWSADRNPEELKRWWVNCVHYPPDGLVRKGILVDKELIGYADLVLLNEYTAELGVAIGKSECWGKGIGVQAAALMMEHGTAKFNITSFLAETHEANRRSVKMLKKLGFQEVSRTGYEKYQGEDSRLIQYELNRTNKE